MITPVDADRLEQLLVDTGYDSYETEFVVDGFRHGFDLGYWGEIDNIRRTAPNLKLSIGSDVHLWNKVMKEVKCKRFAGPFEEPPFESFIQSPIGLVPKNQGKDTRLIFHLSFPRSGKSINSETPKEFCSVKYYDFSDAIRRCMEEGIYCAIGKSDMHSAFRNLGILPEQYCLLIMKAKDPATGKIWWFADKCLPFGASISCSHFQRVSDAIAHIVKVRNGGKVPINYLDDYLFAAYLKSLCNQQIQVFLDVCSEIKFPVSLEKTFWACHLLTFLGILIDTIRQVVAIPTEKVIRARELIEDMMNSKKTTVYKLQKLCGFLNFLCRCVVPGRAFTRRFYNYFSSAMKPHFHVNVNKEMKKDLQVWSFFLNDATAFCRPFIDFSRVLQAADLDWYTDSSGVIGMGGYCVSSWFQQKWPEDFIKEKKPSIEFLELYAVTTSILLWGHRYRNSRIRLYCDNDSVCKMISNNSSKCRKCMTLIRIIVWHSMVLNLRVFAKHVKTKDNFLADALSRFQMVRFWRDVKKAEKVMNQTPDDIPESIWPMEKIWNA